MIGYIMTESERKAFSMGGENFMEARFDLLPDTALALAAVYLLFFAGAGSAAIGGWCRLRACPISSAAAENRAESEEALLWEKPELAQNAVELRIGFQGGGSALLSCG